MILVYDVQHVDMPIKLGKKKYKTFSGAKRAIMKKRGLSAKRAAAYVATIDRKQNKKRKRR